MDPLTYIINYLVFYVSEVDVVTFTFIRHEDCVATFVISSFLHSLSSTDRNLNCELLSHNLLGVYVFTSLSRACQLGLYCAMQVLFLAASVRVSVKMLGKVSVYFRTFLTP